MGCACVFVVRDSYERSPWVLQWGVSVCVVNKRDMDVFCGCYNGVYLSVFVVNERVRELWTFTVGVTVGCVCLCLL